MVGIFKIWFHSIFDKIERFYVSFDKVMGTSFYFIPVEDPI